MKCTLCEEKEVALFASILNFQWMCSDCAEELSKYMK